MLTLDLVVREMPTFEKRALRRRGGTETVRPVFAPETLLAGKGKEKEEEGRPHADSPVSGIQDRDVSEALWKLPEGWIALARSESPPVSPFTQPPEKPAEKQQCYFCLGHNE